MLLILNSHQMSAHIHYYWHSEDLFLDWVMQSYLLATILKSFKAADINNYLHKHNFSWKIKLEKSPWWCGF